MWKKEWHEDGLLFSKQTLWLLFICLFNYEVNSFHSLLLHTEEESRMHTPTFTYIFFLGIYMCVIFLETKNGMFKLLFLWEQVQGNAVSPFQFSIVSLVVFQDIGTEVFPRFCLCLWLP